MEYSEIYDLLEMKKLGKYREELEKDENDNFNISMQESRELLVKKLGSDDIKLLDKYKFDIDMRNDYINYQVGIIVLNYGIKIGMQLQSAFEEMKK